MALATFSGLYNHGLQMAGLSGSAKTTLMKEWINKAHQEVCEAHDWPELEAVAYIETVAPYTTGTATFTNGDATVAGVGTTWTSAVASRKIATAITEPWFLISSRTSDTELEMERAWAFATAAGSAYTIYQDEYALDSTVDKVFLERTTLHLANGYVMGSLPPGRGLSLYDLPTGTGKPEHIVLLPQSNGQLKAKIGPRAPDGVYVIRYFYKKKHVALVNDGDVPQLAEGRLELVVARALVWAYQLPQYADTGLAQQQFALYQRMLADHISRSDRAKPRRVIPAAFGSSPTVRRQWWSYPVSAD